MIDKFAAARRQIECAIKLVAAVEDELAVHTLAMAAYGILEDLAKGSIFYEVGLKPHLTKIGESRLRDTAAFLKHADRDPERILKPFDPRENDWRISFCLLLYRSLKGAFTPPMAAFHCWMIMRHPDHFMLAEDDDSEFERGYREAVEFLRKEGRAADTVFLTCLLRVFQDGLIPTDTGFARRSRIRY